MYSSYTTIKGGERLLDNGTMEIFSRNVERLMIEKNMSFRTLANAINTPHNTIYNHIKYKRSIPLPLARKIANYLGKDLDWITTNHEE